MTPLQKTLTDLIEKSEREIKWCEDDIKQSMDLINSNSERIAYNKELIKELRRVLDDTQVHERGEVPTSRASGQGKEGCTDRDRDVRT